jgi:hypothetical protein
VCKRYSVLPSRLLDEGNTIDMYVASLGVSYDSYLQEKAEKGQSANTPNQESLQNMLDRVRAKHNGS